MIKKVFITGGSGLLALNWALEIRDRFDVILGLHNRIVSLEEVQTCPIGIGSYDHFFTSLNRIKPDILIHTAGLANVEICEQSPLLAYQVNVEMTEIVSRVCSVLGIKLVHISTDHLFQGNIPNVEEDQSPDPKNKYGETKAEAELKVMENCPDAIIARTNFFGWGTSYRKSFSDFIIENLRNGKTINLFQDVYYTPIHTANLTKIIHTLLDNGSTGIYNIVGDDRLSKFQFGLKIAQHFQLDSDLIWPGYLSAHTDLVQRPFDMSLSNSKISDLLHHQIGSIDEQIILLKQQEQTGHSKEIQSL